MPKVKSDDTESSFMERCIPMLIQDEGKEQDEAVAICASLWEQSNKNNTSKQYIKELLDKNIDVVIKINPDKLK